MIKIGKMAKIRKKLVLNPETKKKVEKLNRTGLCSTIPGKN